MTSVSHHGEGGDRTNKKARQSEPKKGKKERKGKRTEGKGQREMNRERDARPRERGERKQRTKTTKGGRSAGDYEKRPHTSKRSGAYEINAPCKI